MATTPDFSDLDAAARDNLRGWADLLAIWRLCGRLACGRACACRGDPAGCFRDHYGDLPEGAQLWFVMMMDAKAAGLSFDAAIARLDGTEAEASFIEWNGSACGLRQRPLPGAAAVMGRCVSLSNVRPLQGRRRMGWHSTRVERSRRQSASQIRVLKTIAAWDRHDPEGLSEALADDAQFITVNGAWTTSREGFRDLMRRLHGPSGPFRSSTRRSPETQVRFLSPDIAILHTRFFIDGEVLHDELSQASRESVGTRVLRKLDGRWRIVATQNTDVRLGRRH